MCLCRTLSCPCFIPAVPRTGCCKKWDGGSDVCRYSKSHTTVLRSSDLFCGAKTAGAYVWWEYCLACAQRKAVSTYGRFSALGVFCFSSASRKCKFVKESKGSVFFPFCVVVGNEENPPLPSNRKRKKQSWSSHQKSTLTELRPLSYVCSPDH